MDKIKLTINTILSIALLFSSLSISLFTGESFLQCSSLTVLLVKPLLLLLNRYVAVV